MSEPDDKPAAPALPPRGVTGSADRAYEERKGRGDRRKKRNRPKGAKRNSGRQGRAARPYDRLKRCNDLLVLCYSHAEIRHILAEEWNVSPETVSKYIQDCYKIWKRDAAPPEEERLRTSEALAKMFQMAVREKQPGPALRALEVRSRVLGLYTERVQVDNVVKVINQNAAERIDLSDAPPEVLAYLRRKAEERLIEPAKTSAPPEVVGDAEVIEKGDE